MAVGSLWTEGWHQGSTMGWGLRGQRPQTDLVSILSAPSPRVASPGSVCTVILMAQTSRWP